MENFCYDTLSTQDKKNYKRFLSYIEKRGRVNTNMSPCWTHTTSKSSSGYGQICLQNNLWNLHRYSYYIHSNCQEIPEGHHICHKCDNKDCCNPEHLYCGTAKENAKDTWDRGLKVKKETKSKRKLAPFTHEAQFNSEQTQGENNVKAILTKEQVITILKRHKAGLKYGELKRMAEEYGVKYNTIQKLVAGDTWKEIDRDAL